MNSAYKLVWSAVFQAWVVASELAKGTKKGSKKAVKSGVVVALITGLGIVQASAAPAANAVPVGEHVVSGSASFNRNVDNRLIIRQSTGKLITNWDNFDVGNRAQVIFVQPDASSLALNRVTSGNASQILGKLDANGQVVLVNPNGITFGSGAQVNAASIVASTMDIKDANFLKDSLQFERGQSTANVVNEGKLTATEGNVTLLAANIENKGNINSGQGNIFLVNADKARVLDTNVSVGQVISANSSIKNSGSLSAIYIEKGKGQVLLLSSYSSDYMKRGQIEAQGKIDAGAVKVRAGTVLIKSALDVSGNLSIDAKDSFQVNAPLTFLGNGVINLNHAENYVGFSINEQGKINIDDKSARLRINGEQYRVVNTLEQLLGIGKNSASLSGSYVLGKDIDASTSNSWNGGLGWKPIGNIDNPFKGKIIGFNNKISNISINRSAEDSVGMFGVLSNSSIHFLNLSGFKVNGATKVGALAGEAYNSNVGYVNIDTSITGISSIGGVAGYSSGSKYDRLKAIVNISAKNSFVGGIVGYSAGGYVNASSVGNIIGDISPVMGGLVGYSDGTNVSGSSNIKLIRTGILYDSLENGMGGLVGYNKLGNIFGNGYGSISGKGYIGGLVGFNSGVIGSSYFYGVVNGNGQSDANILTYAGGIAGYNSGSVLSSQTQFAKISGEMVGGLVGYNKGSTLGNTVYWSSPEVLPENIGGLVGVNEGLIRENDVYSIHDALHATNSVGGLVNYNMKNGVIDHNFIHGLTVVGKINVGGFVAKNQGIIKAENRIRDAGNRDKDGLRVVGEKNVGGFIGLNNSRSVFYPLITSASVVVSGIENSGGWIGLNNGRVEAGAALSREFSVLGLNNTGGIVGLNNGIIEGNYDFYFYGNVNGLNNVGGIAGLNNGKIDIFKKLTFLDFLLTGVYNVGGIVGLNNGELKYNYYNGSPIVVGINNVNPVVGLNQGAINKY